MTKFKKPDIMKTKFLAAAWLIASCGSVWAQPKVTDGTSYLMNQAVDVSTDFYDLSNTMFFN